MTDQIKEQDVELNDDENEVLEAHDPMNAEMQSVDSVDKAGDVTNKAPARKGDKSNSEPMPKTKAGMVNAMYNKMNGMKKEQLKSQYEAMMGEAVEFDEDEMSSEYKEDLQALIANDDSLSEDFKKKAATIFEAAVHSKFAEKESEMNSMISEKVEALEEQYAEYLAEGIEAAKDELVEKVDSYLNYVVETWMEENKVAVEKGLRTEIAETFMNNLKNLFTESYIEIPESKVDLVDGLVEQVEELESLLNQETQKNIDIREYVESLKRKMIIREAAKDLAETQVSKLEKLAEGVEFVSDETFAEKIMTIKESYFAKKAIVSEQANKVEMIQEETDESVSVSASMEHYLTALRNR